VGAGVVCAVVGEAVGAITGVGPIVGVGLTAAIADGERSAVVAVGPAGSAPPHPATITSAATSPAIAVAVDLSRIVTSSRPTGGAGGW
jgi:hypothetical protein